MAGWAAGVAAGWLAADRVGPVMIGSLEERKDMIKPRSSQPPQGAARIPHDAVRRLFAGTLCAAALCGLVPAALAQTAASAASSLPALLVLGDSLSAEYGLPRGTGWVALLEARLREHKFDYRVVNASISGDTTSGGVSRLPALLARHRPGVVVIELGSNDALRGLSLQMTEQNLNKMVQASRQAGARVLLVGMQIPPNYGRDYTQRFQQLFAKVAKEQQAALLPFLLDGVAQHIELFQPDRLHPTAQAQPRLLDNVWPRLEPLLGTGKS